MSGRALWALALCSCVEPLQLGDRVYACTSDADCVAPHTCQTVDGRSVCTAGSSDTDTTDLPAECFSVADGLVTDACTGNTWLVGLTESADWSTIEAVCASKDDAGRSWRTPTIEELRTLVSGCASIAPDGDCLVGLGCSDYDVCWSQESCVCGAVGQCFFSKVLEPSFPNICLVPIVWSSTPLTGSTGVPSAGGWGISFQSGSVVPHQEPQHPTICMESL